MIVKIAIYNSTALEYEYDVAEFPLVVGRDADADICLNDRWASRRHCELTVRDGVVVVRDLDSKHGTMVNDQLVEEAPLRPGDRLMAGLSSLIAAYPAPASLNRSEPLGRTAVRVCLEQDTV